jgi:hypothetical protein
LRRTKPTSTEAPLDRPIDDFVGAWILSALLPYQPVALDAQPINSALHPAQQLLGRRGRDTGPLKVLYLFALSQDLAAHVLDFGTDTI